MEKLNHIKIGIIGARGFIGSNLVRYLEQSPLVLLHAVNRSQFQTVDQMQDFLSHVDTVVYLAHEGGPNQNLPYSEDLARNLAPLNLFLSQVTTLNRQSRLNFIYLSSGGTVYGISKTLKPWQETDALYPVSTYAQVKIAIEARLQEFASQAPINIACLRASNPYSNAFTHAKPQGVIDVIVSCLVNQQTFTLYGAPENVRDFIHLDDLNSAILTCARAMSTGWVKPFQIFNVGSGKGTSLAEMISQIESLSGKNLPLVLKSPDPTLTPIPWSVLNIEKIKNELNWEPKIPLEEGLKELVNRKIAHTGQVPR